jgi:hypothetical protein
MFKALLAGFTINLFTSADDALTRIPILSSSARTLKGMAAFSLGNLLAVTLAVAISYGLSHVLVSLPGGNMVIASLVFILAGIVYFDVLKLKPPKKIEEHIEVSKATPQRLLKLVGLGFIMTFITMIDDMFALTPLLTGSFIESLPAIIGIYIAALLLIFIVIYFADKLIAFAYKREFATLILLIFGTLIFFGVL